MTQSRWQSKVLWAGILSTIMVFMGQVGLYETLGITQEWLQHVVDLVLSLLTAFSILNNPENKTGF